MTPNLLQYAHLPWPLQGQNGVRDLEISACILQHATECNQPISVLICAFSLRLVCPWHHLLGLWLSLPYVSVASASAHFLCIAASHLCARGLDESSVIVEHTSASVAACKAALHLVDHQIRIAEEDMPKTGFTTPFGHDQFKVMWHPWL